MYVKNYHTACDELYPFLRDYLQEQNIDISGGHFRCINPKHEDKDPSTSLHPSNNTFKCFGCGVGGGIFHAAHFLEGKPMVGSEFLVENLAYLAKKFNVTLEHEPLTEEQLYELDTYRAYRAASELTTGGKHTTQFNRVIAERGWTGPVCHDFGVGFVEDYKSFREGLKNIGFSAKFLDDIDLGRDTIFGPDRLIFTICDDRGRPVGFASRNLLYTDDKENGAKYINQRGTGVKCNIYQKSKRLFGLHQFLQKREKRSDPIYIFEGYSDVVTAGQHGLYNSCAIGGTALTLDHLLILKDHNCYDIILCLDGDDVGQKRTAELLDNILSGHKDLNIRIVIIPEKQDPDEFIREFGVEKFRDLKKWSAFEWRMSQFSDETAPELICGSMIPLIVNETSYIKQETMAKTLASFTGMTLKAIHLELDRLQNEKTGDRVRDRQLVIDRMVQDLKKDPASAEYAIHEAESSLFDLARQYEEDSFSIDSCLAMVNSQKQHQESLDGSFSGFLLGAELKNLQDALCGQWKKDVWLCFGGKPNSGKTSFMVKLLFEIAKHEENNACVIYHSIDDTFEQVLPKFVCVAEGSNKVTLNEVMDPNYYIRDSIDTPLMEKREIGYRVLQELISDGRLVIKDANNGISLAYADMLVKYYKKKFPDRDIIYVLDNFHKLSDFHGTDERVRFKEMSKAAKSLATSNHICVITTVEYRKTKRGEKAGNDDIGETGQIEYDANLIVHLYNEVHEKGDAATHCHYHSFSNGEEKRCPRVELSIGKNKITAFKNALWYDFYPESSGFRMVNDAMVVHDAQKEKGKLSESSAEIKTVYEEACRTVIEKHQKPARVMHIIREYLDLDDDDAGKNEAWKHVKKLGGLPNVPGFTQA